jgi:hypothetical protein
MSALRKLVTVLLSFSLGFLVVSAARADDYPSALAEAIGHRDRALESQNPEDWELALRGFQSALALEPTKEAWFELASAAARLGFHDQACEAYQEALELGLNPRAQQEAQSFLDEHLPKMANAVIHGPPGAVVHINGRRRGVLPFARPALVPEGTIDVRVEVDGARPWSRRSNVVAKTTITFEVNALPEPSPAPVGAAHPARADAPAPAPAPAAAGRWPVPVMIAGGSVALGGSAVVILASNDLASDRESLDANCMVQDGDTCISASPELREAAQQNADDIAQDKVLRAVDYGATGLGLVAVAVAAYYELTQPRQGKARARPVLVGAGFTGRTFLLEGRF